MASKVGRALLCVLASCLAPSASAATIDLFPATQLIFPGGDATVQIRVAGLQDFGAPSLSAFDVDVSYVPSVLQLDHVLYGDPIAGDQLDLRGLGSLIQTISGIGRINLFELSFDSSADLNSLQRGGFVLATLVFRGLAPGSSPLGLSINALGDASGNSLAATTTGAQVGVTPEPSSLLLIGTGLVLLCRRHRRRRFGEEYRRRR